MIEKSPNTTLLRFKPLWLCIGAGMLFVITWSSLTPLMVKVVTIQHSDLLLHLLAYGGITFWFHQIFTRSQQGLFLMAFFFAYGLLMEAAQGALTDTRDANILDVIANTLGVILGWLLSRPFLPKGILHHIEQLLPGK